MIHRLLWACYATCLFQPRHSRAQETVQQILWNVPDGNLTDLSQTFTAGTTLPLSWNGWTSPDYIDASKTLVDLWVTAWDYNLNPFSQLLKENLNVITSGNYAWTIAIPDSNLAVSAKYVLRFKAHASSYDPNSEDLSSPGFLVLAAAVSSTSPSSSPTTLAPSSISTISTISSSSTQAILSPSPSVSSTATPDVSCSSCGLTAGAKAGIGIGVVIAVLALVGAAYFAFKRRRQKGEIRTEQKPHQPRDDIGQGQQGYLPNSYPIELPTYPAELPTRDVWSQAELPSR